ncbi:MAG: hypothetical protein ABS862_01600 [Carnobacterium inhibens]|uniref:hypothetical protein n=1 Tax=Carnobacterium sp. TaxID=48221 RepID=UPI0033157336
MNYKQMVLTDFLLNNILSISDFKLVFEMDNKLYTGDFTKKTANGYPTIDFFSPGWGYETNENILDSAKRQELRIGFFNYTFGENAKLGNRVFEQYTQNMHHLILKDITGYISNLEKNYFDEDIVIPEVILGLKNIETNQSFEHYLVIGKEFNPVSFIKSK